MKILNNINIHELVSFVDKKWLFSGLWHLKRSVEEGERALKNIEENISSYNFRPKLIYKKFVSKYEKGTLALFSDGGEEISRFEFDDKIFNKFSKSKPVSSEIVLLSATVGDEVKEIIDGYHSQGDYKDYFYLSGYAAALAEAATEYGNHLAAKEFNFEYDKSFRLSPGYKTWPDLVDQMKISRLIPMEEIGIFVSETLQLHPEFSTTAIIFWI